MKSILFAAAAALAVSAAPALAHAETQVYATVGYAGIDVDPVNLGAIQGRLGAMFTPNIGIEGEAAFGVAGDNIGPIDVDLSNEFGAFLVLNAPVSENVDLFARLGWASGEVDAGALGSVSDDGAAYGVGAQYLFDGSNGVRFDYTRYDFNGDANAWSVAFVHKF